MIAVQIFDPTEKVWPVTASVTVEDAETGELLTLPAGSTPLMQRALDERNEAVAALCRSAAVDRVEIESGTEVLKPLVKFFAARNSRRRR